MLDQMSDLMNLKSRLTRKRIPVPGLDLSQCSETISEVSFHINQFYAHAFSREIFMHVSLYVLNSV